MTSARNWRNSADRYGCVSQAFHWAVAALALHVAGALTHAVIDRDRAKFRRMWG